MNLMPDKTPGPPIVKSPNATAKQSHTTEAPPMKLVVLPSSASSAWGGGGGSSDPSAADIRHSRRLCASKTMELYC